MPSADRGLGDLKIAAVIGVVTELLMASWTFEADSELAGQHPWLEFSQMPGAQISERLFRHVGVLPAMAFALLVQGALFTIIALGVIYAYRLLRRSSVPPSADGR